MIAAIHTHVTPRKERERLAEYLRQEGDAASTRTARARYRSGAA